MSRDSWSNYSKSNHFKANIFVRSSYPDNSISMPDRIVHTKAKQAWISCVKTKFNFGYSQTRCLHNCRIRNTVQSKRNILKKKPYIHCFEMSAGKDILTSRKKLLYSTKYEVCCDYFAWNVLTKSCFVKKKKEERCSFVACQQNNKKIEVCFQSWFYPLWLTGFKTPTN